MIMKNQPAWFQASKVITQEAMNLVIFLYSYKFQTERRGLNA